MIDTEKLVISGQELARAFDLLDRANAASLPTTPQLITKQGLLVAARQAVTAARDALAH